MVDNLGRVKGGSRLGELKGLSGHVYDAKALRTGKFKLKQLDSFSKRIIPRQQSHLAGRLERMAVWSAELSIPLTKVAPIHVSFTDIPHHGAIICNKQTVGFFPSAGLDLDPAMLDIFPDESLNTGDVTLGSELRKGKNVLSFLLWGDVTPQTLENIKFHLLGENLSQGASWSVRPWGPPEECNTASGRGIPAWYSVNFKCSDRENPLFLQVGGAKKGQIYLNGHNLGRFWTIGPQRYYYLPSCWLADDNTVMLFDEHGKSPVSSKLVYRHHGPFEA